MGLGRTELRRGDSTTPCFLQFRAMALYVILHLAYITTIVNTFYGGIIWLWVCQVGVMTFHCEG